MHDSEPSTQPKPPVYAVLNRNKNRAFDLGEHKVRTAKVFADFDEYRKILGTLKRRVEALENSLKRARTG